MNPRPAIMSYRRRPVSGIMKCKIKLPTLLLFGVILLGMLLLIPGGQSYAKQADDITNNVQIPRRVMFIADTHASVDEKDRSLTWGVNSFSRLQSAFKLLSPNYLVWLGDMIDFLPAEWDIVKTWVDWVKINYPGTEQHALMGNHDYLYYHFPDVYDKYLDILPNEITTSLTAKTVKGQKILNVKNTGAFIRGKSVIVIQTPDYDASNKYFVSHIAAIDSAAKTITLHDKLNHTFMPNGTEVRQGYSNARGINKFLAAFSGTKTTSTKHAFTVGNTVFIMLSMDNYYSGQSINDVSINAISREDLDWLERTTAKYHQTHNVIICTHFPPDKGSEIGGLRDGKASTLNRFSPEIKNRFRLIASNYKVAAWVMGHVHPDARTDKVSGRNTDVWSSTTFIMCPSLGMGSEGQLISVDFANGGTILDFKYWSTDTGKCFKTVSVPVSYAIDLSMNLGSLQGRPPVSFREESQWNTAWRLTVCDQDLHPCRRSN
jgi:metallophosphoesterase superfamily enzyme